MGNRTMQAGESGFTRFHDGGNTPLVVIERLEDPDSRRFASGVGYRVKIQADTFQEYTFDSRWVDRVPSDGAGPDRPG